MTSYTTLVQQILQVPALEKQVEEFSAENDALNLIATDWKERLENHTLFQEFQLDARQKFQSNRSSANNLFRVQNLKDDVAPLKAIVAGFCNIYKPYENVSRKQSMAITMRESPVMDMLTKAITSDIDSKLVQLSETCKLNLKACSVYCQYCSNAMESMAAKGIKINFNCLQPCIIDTMVYDGKTLTNRFGSQIETYFPGMFVVIAKIELNVRYFYSIKEKKTKMVRVGGSVLKMIAFPESNLKEAKIDLGDLNLIAQVGTVLDNGSSSSDLKRKHCSEENSTGKHCLEDDDEDEEEDVLDALPSEKKVKTWEDDFEVEESALLFE